MTHAARLLLCLALGLSMALSGCGGGESSLPPAGTDLFSTPFEIDEGDATDAERFASLVFHLDPVEGLEMSRDGDVVVLPGWTDSLALRAPLHEIDPARIDSLSLAVRCAEPTVLRFHIRGGDGWSRPHSFDLSFPAGQGFAPGGVRMPRGLRALPKLNPLKIERLSGSGPLSLRDLGFHLSPAIQIASVALEGRSRPCLPLPPGSAAHWNITVPENAHLSFHHAARLKPDGRAVARIDLVVSVQAEGAEPEILLRQPMGPAGGELPHRWTPVKLKLSSYAGREVELRFESRARGGETPVTSLIAAPRLHHGQGERENVLLIVIDTLRYDRLGSYGYARATSPRIDALADSALVFEHAYATAPWTHPSTASILSGLYPGQHGLGIIPGKSSRYRRGTRLLAEEFRRDGYATGAISNNPIVSADEGFARGFACFDTRSFLNHDEKGAERVTRYAMDWLNEIGNSPFFLYVHYFDPHDPYQAPLPQRDMFVAEERDERVVGAPIRQGKVNQLRDKIAKGPRALGPELRERVAYLSDLYDGEVRYVDHWIGRLLDELARRGRLENTTVLITSDHGEEFLEHDKIKHAHSLYEELVRVPMVYRPAGWKNGGQRVTAEASTTDIMTTLLRQARVPSAARELGPGRDLLELAQGKIKRAPVFTVSYGSFFQTDEPDYVARRAMIDRPWKYIRDLENGTEELYQLDEDAGEQIDLSRRESSRALEMRAMADTVLSREGSGVDNAEDIDPALREKLKAIGYVD